MQLLNTSQKIHYGHLCNLVTLVETAERGDIAKSKPATPLYCSLDKLKRQINATPGLYMLLCQFDTITFPSCVCGNNMHFSEVDSARSKMMKTWEGGSPFKDVFGRKQTETLTILVQ